MTAEHPVQLVVLSRDPFNAESPLSALAADITPTDLHYVRSNFEEPEERVDYRLTVEDGRGHVLRLRLDELMALPDRRVTVTMECAGNNRDGFTPMPDGEPWGLGAVSSATWRGVSLHHVLAMIPAAGDTIEVLCEAADRGFRDGHDRAIPFARSLPLVKALDPDTILAYEMNGEPLPSSHGAPLRLIVPGWYGMCSVKWIARLALLGQPFVGHFQTERYIMRRPGDVADTPLREIQVKSLITEPRHGAELAAAPQLIRGAAWSGAAPISAVDVSINDGPWQPARLLGDAQPYFWRHWQFQWQPTPGQHVIATRARDTTGAVQPQQADWNQLGYVNNSIRRIQVTVRP